MKTNCMTQNRAGHFVIVLAVAFIAGCQSAQENACMSPNPSGAAATIMPAVAETPPMRSSQFSPAALEPHPITAASVPPLAVTPPIRINCGATDKLTDSEGNIWLPDEGSADGSPYQVDDAQISGTKDPQIFRSERYSMSEYNFGVPNGKYAVKLLFAEIYSGITGPGDRVFSFDVQGQEFKNFDIWVKAGGPDKAYIESVDVDVTNGELNITFTPGVENPKVNGIEILPQP